MKYIIMCGGQTEGFATPRQLTQFNGEPIVGRTIRLLREAGATDIAISSNNKAFDGLGVPVLHHDNTYCVRGYSDCDGYWCDAFYPSDEPAVYLFGDVIFSPEAIRTIVDTETDDILLFGSKPPFAPEYPKQYIEPFAFKVVDTEHLRQACRRVKILDKRGVFKRKPIAWELWSVIKKTNPNKINRSYHAINDYTCDIDYPEEIAEITAKLQGIRY